MIITDISEQSIGQQTTVLLQRRWPQLGRELFALECALTATVGAWESTGKKERIRQNIIGQLYRHEEKYSLDARYCALLFVEKGRGGEIIGNPYCIGKDGQKQELPYTGLEGYYAGSEKAAGRPGMTTAEIIQEEANIGAELLSTIKKHSINNYSWGSFAKLKKAVEGGQPSVEDLKTIGLLWAKVVRRLHVRVYNNSEFESTLTEQIEQVEKLLGTAATGTQEGKDFKRILQAEYERLKTEKKNLSKEEKEREREERRERERIRRERLAEYNKFREETYSMLKEIKSNEYDVSVRDASWEDANIIEMIHLPKTRDRNDYTPTMVKLTPEQLDGYLFLAQLGEIGGDPLARSALISEYSLDRLPIPATQKV